MQISTSQLKPAASQPLEKHRASSPGPQPRPRPSSRPCWPAPAPAQAPAKWGWKGGEEARSQRRRLTSSGPANVAVKQKKRRALRSRLAWHRMHVISASSAQSMAALTSINARCCAAAISLRSLGPRRRGSGCKGGKHRIQHAVSPGQPVAHGRGLLAELGPPPPGSGCRGTGAGSSAGQMGHGRSWQSLTEERGAGCPKVQRIRICDAAVSHTGMQHVDAGISFSTAQRSAPACAAAPDRSAWP